MEPQRQRAPQNPRSVGWGREIGRQRKAPEGEGRAGRESFPDRKRSAKAEGRWKIGAADESRQEEG